MQPFCIPCFCEPGGACDSLTDVRRFHLLAYVWKNLNASQRYRLRIGRRGEKRLSPRFSLEWDRSTELHPDGGSRSYSYYECS